MTMFLMMMIVLAFMFMFMNHPLSFGLILLLQTILTSIYFGLLAHNFWYSYILFLVMIGGMLILFMYMTSVASNEKFKFSMKLFILFNIMSNLSMITLLIDPFYTNLINNQLDLSMSKENLNFQFSIIKYINFPNNMIFMLMIIYLFITLIVVVKISGTNFGTLRQKF
uniref:NADH-ubiquinone oxidoreductase chain 6 n=1 Tax=Tritoma bipustulata TaxID=295904 RepID=E3VTF1_9CUCU|nr:NADH dehydrogenase subunit 6 [Tritoma bipustulata]